MAQRYDTVTIGENDELIVGGLRVKMSPTNIGQIETAFPDFTAEIRGEKESQYRQVYPINADAKIPQIGIDTVDRQIQEQIGGNQGLSIVMIFAAMNYAAQKVDRTTFEKLNTKVERDVKLGNETRKVAVSNLRGYAYQLAGLLPTEPENIQAPTKARMLNMWLAEGQDPFTVPVIPTAQAVAQPEDTTQKAPSPQRPLIIEKALPKTPEVRIRIGEIETLPFRNTEYRLALVEALREKLGPLMAQQVVINEVQLPFVPESRDALFVNYIKAKGGTISIAELIALQFALEDSLPDANFHFNKTIRMIHINQEGRSIPIPFSERTAWILPHVLNAATFNSSITPNVYDIVILLGKSSLPPVSSSSVVVESTGKGVSSGDKYTRATTSISLQGNIDLFGIAPTEYGTVVFAGSKERAKVIETFQSYYECRHIYPKAEAVRQPELGVAKPFDQVIVGKYVRNMTRDELSLDVVTIAPIDVIAEIFALEDSSLPIKIGSGQTNKQYLEEKVPLMVPYHLQGRINAGTRVSRRANMILEAMNHFAKLERIYDFDSAILSANTQWLRAMIAVLKLAEEGKL